MKSNPKFKFGAISLKRGYQKSLSQNPPTYYTILLINTYVWIKVVVWTENKVEVAEEIARSQFNGLVG